MSFGFQRQPRIFITDTSTLNAYVYEDDDSVLVPRIRLASVAFTVLKPDDDQDTPTISAASGEILDDGWGQYLVLGSVTDVPGEYKAMAQFTLGDGRIKSVSCDFDAIDPFERVGLEVSDPAVEQVWRKLEDCFDSELGAPWLRDMTEARFDKTKLKLLIPEALAEINSWQPFTNFDEEGYPYTDGTAETVFVQGLLCASIRHLRRSYVEQPTVENSPVGFLDRTRYADAWGVIYEEEYRFYKQLLAMWKRTLLNLGHSKLLLGSKAGRLLPAPMRTRGGYRGAY